MKKIIAAVLCLAMILTSCCFTFAANKTSTESADALYGLGLFKGKSVDKDGNPNYALEDAPTRNEAVTMLVRLLGKEQEALNGNWDLPFTDLDNWVKPYVGYAYANGLTKGMSAKTFGGSLTITASQYLTFVLRALGYKDGSNLDFMYDSAWTLSDKLGMTNGEYNAKTTAFTRGNVASISESALTVNLKNQTYDLLTSLVNAGAVDSAAASSYRGTNRLYETVTLSNYSKVFNYLISYIKTNGQKQDNISSVRAEIETDDGDVYYYSMQYSSNSKSIELMIDLQDEENESACYYSIELKYNPTVATRGFVLDSGGEGGILIITPSVITFDTELSSSDFMVYSGDESDKADCADMYATALKIILACTNQFILSGKNYSVQDLGFTSFKY